MSLSVVNDSLWKVASGQASNPWHYESNSGFGLVKIAIDEYNWAYADTGINFPTVTGILLEPFTYTMESTWESIKTPFDFGLSDMAGDISSFLGGGSVGKVFTSKLHWRNSGYIKMSPKFRIYDRYGTGECTAVAQILSLYTVSSFEASIPGLKTFLDRVTAKADEIQSASFDNTEPLTGLDLTRAVLLDGARTGLSGVEDFVTLRASPPPMILSIARIFEREDMLVTNITVEYSKEASEWGPLWVDVTLDCTSRTIVSSPEDMGLLQAGGDFKIDVSGLDDETFISANSSAAISAN